MGLVHQGWWIRVILQAHMRRWPSGCTEEAGREDVGLLRICYRSFLFACHSSACSIQGLWEVTAPRALPSTTQHEQGLAEAVKPVSVIFQTC